MFEHLSDVSQMFEHLRCAVLWCVFEHLKCSNIGFACSNIGPAVGACSNIGPAVGQCSNIGLASGACSNSGRVLGARWVVGRHWGLTASGKGHPRAGLCGMEFGSDARGGGGSSGRRLSVGRARLELPCGRLFIGPEWKEGCHLLQADL